MPYGIIKIDTVIFTDAGVDKSVSISGLVQNPTFSGNVTVTGTISGVTVTGTTASFTSGNFTNISGGTHTITSGVFAAGSAANPSISFTSDPNTGIYSPGADQVAISTNGTGRLFVDSSGNVGVGTTSVNTTLEVLNSSAPIIRVGDGTRHMELRGGSTTQNAAIGTNYAGSFDIIQNGSAAVTVDASKRVGIGTTQPSALLQVGTGNVGTATARAVFNTNDTTNSAITVSNWTGTATTNGPRIAFDNSTRGTFDIGGGNGVHSFVIRDSSAASDRLTIDSSGRLLVGTSSNLTSDPVQISFSQADSLGGLSITNQQWYGYGARILFQAKNNSSGDIKTLGAIIGESDGQNKGRLVFSTTADGGSSPTRRVVMRNNGWVVFGQDTENGDAVGIGMDTPNGTMYVNSFNTTTFQVGRISTDGTLISFRHENAEEGSISVSGSTVSYNGAHLSRWSQLLGGAERTEILRGTVLSNIDEMCQWGEENNEQLNRMKVSDVEGDKNVSGVFQAWDDDDDIYTNDFYCAMTGDFIIRIGSGVTVERGDLLMSAGDGTAKPQDDDIIRSKTIAKVTSTNVSCTYDDGSYCVPCVLMAC